MQGPLFQIDEDRVAGDHRYVRVVPVNPDSLAADLAPRILDAYIDLVDARKRLERAAAELDVFDGSAVELTNDEVNAAIQDAVDAAVPRPWTAGGRPRQLDTQRSELAELVAVELMRGMFAASVPAMRIRHKEVPDQQTRGADVLAIEGADTSSLVLILCEVKASEDRKSPPGVVADMKTKLLQLATDRRVLTQELTWLRDHAETQYIDLADRIYISHVLKRPVFSIVLSPILVRRAELAAPSDHGVFESDADGFGHPIRWITVAIDADLQQFSQEVYELARAAAA